jgi:hypothetical protein
MAGAASASAARSVRELGEKPLRYSAGRPDADAADDGAVAATVDPARVPVLRFPAATDRAIGASATSQKAAVVKVAVSISVERPVASRVAQRRRTKPMPAGSVIEVQLDIRGKAKASHGMVASATQRLTARNLLTDRESRRTATTTAAATIASGATARYTVWSAAQPATA